MLLEMRYPVFVNSAILPRHAKPRRAMAILRTVVELAEGDSADYPVVLEVNYPTENPSRHHETNFPYRHRNGTFYRRLKKRDDQSIENLVICHDEVWRGTFVKAALRSGSKRGDVLPRQIVHRIVNRGMITREALQMERIGRTMEQNPDTQEAINVALADLNQALRAILVIDGEFWEKTNEPRLCVNPHDFSNTYVDTPDFHSRKGVENAHLRMFFQRIHYSMGEADRVLASLPPETKTRSEINVLDPSVFSADLPIGATVAMLLSLCEDKNMPASMNQEILAYADDIGGWDWARAADLTTRLATDVYAEDDVVRVRLEAELEFIDRQPINVPIMPSPRHLTCRSSIETDLRAVA